MCYQLLRKILPLRKTFIDDFSALTFYKRFENWKNLIAGIHKNAATDLYVAHVLHRPVLENVSFDYFECRDEHFHKSWYSFLEIYDILSFRGFTIVSVKYGELLTIQRGSTFPKCINLFAFKDMEQFVVRMGLRA